MKRTEVDNAVREAPLSQTILLEIKAQEGVSFFTSRPVQLSLDRGSGTETSTLQDEHCSLEAVDIRRTGTCMPAWAMVRTHSSSVVKCSRSSKTLDTVRTTTNYCRNQSHDTAVPGKRFVSSKLRSTYFAGKCCKFSRSFSTVMLPMSHGETAPPFSKTRATIIVFPELDLQLYTKYT